MKKKTKKTFFGRIARFAFRIMLYGILISITYAVYCRFFNPPFTITQLSSIVSGDGIHRNYLRYNAMGTDIKLAVMAGEDQNFPTHNGFDYKSIEMAIQHNQKKKRMIRGASTISQQTAKNVFLWQHGGWFRKGLEVYFTFLIEHLWSKQRILETYLNVAEMGPGVFGIGAAAQYYFHKKPKDLTAAEAAKIASCLPNPVEFTIKPLSRRVAARFPWIMKNMVFLQNQEEVRKILVK